MDIGELYLGGALDPTTGEHDPARPVLYERHRLTTHGVIVGMTGSGKTGPGLIALEEALLSGVPVPAIDPKGDIGNLLLTFPKLGAHDFRPWIDEGEARRTREDADTFAAGMANLWKNGLADRGIGGDCIARLKEAARFTIYTPGSQAGVPLNIVGSLVAPGIDRSADAEAARDEIEGFVSSLLVLAGIEADPISPREHILLSDLIETSWQADRSLDLGSLIAQVRTPPLRKLGVFDLDTFFPPRDRTKPAMRLNGLTASPSFASWIQGAPLEPQTLLYTPEGTPRAAVIRLQHLSDQERRFVLTLLLSKMVTWIRRRPDTSDLRALIHVEAPLTCRREPGRFRAPQRGCHRGRCRHREAEGPLQGQDRSGTRPARHRRSPDPRTRDGHTGPAGAGTHCGSRRVVVGLSVRRARIAKPFRSAFPQIAAGSNEGASAQRARAILGQGRGPRRPGGRTFRRRHRDHGHVERCSRLDRDARDRPGENRCRRRRGCTRVGTRCVIT